jgi:hypothetical protein
LFNKENGHVKVSLQAADNLADLLDDVWLDTLRRFIEDEQFRFENQGPTNCQLLLLTAG